MVGLFQKDKRLVARLVSEIVPLGAGLALGSFAAPFIGPVGGIPFVFVIWAALSWLLVRVRRRRVLRRVYRLAVLAHVLFWCVQGWLGAALDPPGPPRVVGTLVAAERKPLLAGYGEAFFELPARTTLGGWGTRPRRVNLPALGGFGALGRASLNLMGAGAEGVAPRRPMFRRPDSDAGSDSGPAAGGDALGARALLLRSSGGGGALAFVRLDLVVMEPRLVDALLARVSAMGLDATSLIVTATHTHSAPGGVSQAPLAQVVGTDHADPAVFAAIVDAGVRALDRAAAALRPAGLSFAEARDRDADGRPLLAKTRGVLGDRDPEGEGARVDDRVLLLRVDGLDGRPIGVLLNYAIQPVVVRPRESFFSRDLAGALENAFQEALPGRPPVLFVNGHCGDVTPRREGRSGRDAARTVAARFARAVAAQLDAPEPADRVRIDAALVHRDFGTPHAFAALGHSAALYPALGSGVFGRTASDAAASLLALPANLALWSLTLSEARVGLSFSGAAGGMVNLDRHLLARELAVGAVRIDTTTESRVLLWHPAVGTQALGKAVREEFGETTPFLLGFANGACGYLTTRAEYDRGAYEARSSLYGPDGGRLLREALGAAAGVLQKP